MFSEFNLELIGHEVATASATSARCMVVHPLGKKSKQRLGVGDKDGVVTVFTVGRLGEKSVAFSTPPQQHPVSCMTLCEDQTFVVYGSRLEAYTRKGRMFFSFDTNVTERLHTVFVSIPFIITCGSFMVTGFREGEELGFYIAPDHINAMVAFIAPSAVQRSSFTFDDYRCVVGCSDRVIRMLCGNRLISELSCEASISSMCLSENQHAVYYGTEAGSVGCLDTQKSNVLLTRTLSYIPSDVQSAVTALAVCDINLDSKEELLVGRLDGTVQVFLIVAEEGGNDTTPICIWSGSVGSRVLTIAGGYVTQPNHPDVVVHSFSGKITAFTAGEAGVNVAGDPSVGGSVKDCLEGRTEYISNEIDRIKQEIIHKTQELAEFMGMADGEAPIMAVSSTFTLKCSVAQQVESPALLLAIESDTPLDNVVLQCDVELHILKLIGAVLIEQQEALSKCEDTMTLAILRPVSDQAHNCSVWFWVSDGVPGTIKLTALAAPAPRTAQVRSIPLRPLHLFARVGSDDTKHRKNLGALSVLVVDGAFTVRDIHNWLCQMLPGMPELCQVKQTTLVYENTFFSSVLKVEYGDKRGIFSSDSLVALATIKRFLSNRAVEQSLDVTVGVTLHDDAVQIELQCLAPLLASCNKTANDVRFLEAIRELQGDDSDDLSFLLEERKNVVGGSVATLERECSRALQNAGYIHDYLLNLYNSVADLKPGVAKMSATIKETLGAACVHARAEVLLEELQCSFQLSASKGATVPVHQTNVRAATDVVAEERGSAEGFIT
uniref:Uncharacterized protein TCIL3000_3_2330 n=1 Tax=Trypanosoma congolense (strain IL3000) TaxID=1068625 RepID=G0UK96_TRYCI|nr:unnamed protein product [Trypanosoma congolense IL3000]